MIVFVDQPLAKSLGLGQTKQCFNTLFLSDKACQALVDQRGPQRLNTLIKFKKNIFLFEVIYCPSHWGTWSAHLVNRLGVAGAVRQTPLSPINLVINC